MKKIAEISYLRQIGSSNELQNSTNRLPAYAAERARLLFSLYRKGDASDPEIYVAGITAILAEYSPEVIKHVTDPRTGIARKMKFMPNIAEVAEACDSATVFLKAEKILLEKGWKFSDGKWVEPPRDCAALASDQKE